MTREEAIKILEQRFDSSCRNNLFQNVEKLDYENALWMAISALRSMSETTKPGWISVKDQLPERFKPVLICREKNGKPYVEQGYKDVCEWWKVYGTRTKQVTHWMPLPELPEEG